MKRMKKKEKKRMKKKKRKKPESETLKRKTPSHSVVLMLSAHLIANTDGRMRRARYK